MDAVAVAAVDGVLSLQTYQGNIAFASAPFAHDVTCMKGRGALRVEDPPQDVRELFQH